MFNSENFKLCPPHPSWMCPWQHNFVCYLATVNIAQQSFLSNLFFLSQKQDRLLRRKQNNKGSEASFCWLYLSGSISPPFLSEHWLVIIAQESGLFARWSGAVLPSKSHSLITPLQNLALHLSLSLKHTHLGSRWCVVGRNLTACNCFFVCS